MYMHIDVDSELWKTDIYNSELNLEEGVETRVAGIGGVGSAVSRSSMVSCE